MFSGESKLVEIQPFIAEAQTSASMWKGCFTQFSQLSILTSNRRITFFLYQQTQLLAYSWKKKKDFPQSWAQFRALKCQMFSPTWASESRKIIRTQSPVEALLTKAGSKVFFHPEFANHIVCPPICGGHLICKHRLIKSRNSSTWRVLPTSIIQGGDNPDALMWLQGL